jgi:hypothetical protein
MRDNETADSLSTLAHRPCQTLYRGLAAATTVAFCLVVILCMSATSRASIHVHQNEDGSLVLTNDKRRIPGQDNGGKHTDPDPKAVEMQPEPRAEMKADARDQGAEADAPVESGVGGQAESALDMLVARIENGFRKGRFEPVLEVFNFFPDTADPKSVFLHRESAAVFFKLLFETFGSSQGLSEGLAPKERIHLARVYAADWKYIEGEECVWEQLQHVAPLQDGKGALALNTAVCIPFDAKDRPWVKDMGVSLATAGDNTSLLAETFIQDYKEALNVVAALQRQVELEGGERAGHESASLQEQEPRAGRVEPRSSVPAPDTSAAEESKALEAPAPQPWAGAPVPDMPRDMFPGGGMGNPELLLGLLSGTFIIVVLAASLFFYMFSCLCLYVIARKCDVPMAWLAWIPVAQIHPQVLSAGLPGWWTAAILASCLGGAVPLLGILLTFGVLVAFVYLWMRISERLGSNKWLGLLVLLPIVQFIYPAWLAFKRDQMRAHVNLGKVLTRTVLAFLLLTALCWVLTTRFIVPVLEPFVSGVKAMREEAWTQFQELPATMPETMLPHAGDVPEAPKVREETSGQDFASLDSQAYEKLLATSQAPDDGLAQKPHTRLGPALVVYDTYWRDAAQPHFWLKVILPELPNLTLGNTGRLLVGKVLDAQGADVYNRESTFEDDQFQRLSFQRISWPPPHLETIRNVHLLPGTTENGLSSVSGELRLNLPLRIGVLELAAGDAGGEKQLHGLTATLMKMEGNAVTLALGGDPARHVATFAYDARGERLDSQYSSWSTAGSSTTVSHGYSAPPVRLELLVATGFLEKSYPFTLELRAP